MYLATSLVYMYMPNLPLPSLSTLSPTPFPCLPPSTASSLPPVRLEETIDMSTTVKFVYVHWMGKSVPFVKRGKFGVVQGSIEKQFSVSIHV